MLSETVARCAFLITLHNFLCKPFTVDSARLGHHSRIRSLLSFGAPLQTFTGTAVSGGGGSDDNDGDDSGNYSDTHPRHKRRRVDGGGGSQPIRRSRRYDNQGGGGVDQLDGFSSLTEELTTLNVQAIRPMWNFKV